MKSGTDTAGLYELVRTVCDNHADRPSIHPSWLATEVMVIIEFPRELNAYGYQAAHLQFRQIARSFCRKHYDTAETTEDDMFPETLQQRYPRSSSDDDPEYILLDLLEKDDAHFNVARLRKEGEAKLKHADALEAWAWRKFGKAA